MEGLRGYPADVCILRGPCPHDSPLFLRIVLWGNYLGKFLYSGRVPSSFLGTCLNGFSPQVAAPGPAEPTRSKMVRRERLGTVSVPPSPDSPYDPGADQRLNVDWVGQEEVGSAAGATQDAAEGLFVGTCLL